MPAVSANLVISNDLTVSPSTTILNSFSPWKPLALTVIALPSVLKIVAFAPSEILTVGPVGKVAPGAFGDLYSEMLKPKPQHTIHTTQANTNTGKPILYFFSRSVCLHEKNLSITGVNMFASKIEKHTPSGKLANNLIRTVKIAASAAKTILPALVVGFVTGSVNMKTAPKKIPPVIMKFRANERPQPLTKPIINVPKKIVPTYTAGTLQSITSLIVRKIAHNTRTRTEVSPSAPA